MVENKDHIMLDKWEFNDEVTGVFDEMLERSIPQYHVMREAVAEIATKFFANGDMILDLGCSNGGSINELLVRLGCRATKYIGIEVSEPMIKQARERFKDWDELVQITSMDLRNNFPEYHFGVIQSVLCLCFIPMEYRQKVIRNCFEHLKDNGAFIIVEKLLGETAETDEIYVERYLRMKSDHGYSEEEILRKRLALEGVLVPITPSWLVQLLKNAGFKYVDCFWKWMNFGGYVAVK